jgi:hypothetical protein
MNSQNETTATTEPAEPVELVTSGANHEQTAPIPSRVKFWKVPDRGSQRAPRSLRRGRSGPSRSRLIEWHTLSPQERDGAWKELLGWVTWLHDRYELSVESRLPRCWSQHPGLIEELWALKVWREEIYSSRESSGQAARYWHAELRQTMHAAATFYAAGCRSGHKPAAVEADANPELLDRWAAGSPLAGVPAALLLANANSVNDPELIPDEVMRNHVGAGRARFISETMRDAIEFDSSWWYVDPSHPGTWRRNRDSEFAELCEQRAINLAKADASVARRKALSSMLTPSPAEPAPRGRGQGAESRSAQAGD